MIYLLSDFDQNAEFARRPRMTGRNRGRKRGQQIFGKTRTGRAVRAGVAGLALGAGLTAAARRGGRKGLTLSEAVIAGGATGLAYKAAANKFAGPQQTGRRKRRR